MVQKQRSGEGMQFSMLKKDVLLYFDTESDGHGHFNKVLSCICSGSFTVHHLNVSWSTKKDFHICSYSHSSVNDWILTLLLFLTYFRDGPVFFVFIYSIFFLKDDSECLTDIKLKLSDIELLIPSSCSTFDNSTLITQKPNSRQKHTIPHCCLDGSVSHPHIQSIFMP